MYNNDELDNLRFYITRYSKEILSPSFHDSWKKSIMKLIKQARVANGVMTKNDPDGLIANFIEKTDNVEDN